MTALKWIRRAPLIIASCILQAQLTAGIIFESATAPVYQFPAVVVSNSEFAQQAPGVAFQITQTTQIESIGVWIFHNNNTAPAGLFGEIFPIAGPTSFPSTDPYSSTGLGRTYFDESYSELASELTAPLPLTLTAGYYALIIGTLPSSEWGIPLYGADAPGVVPANFMVYLGGTSFPSPRYPRWQQGPDGMRLFIEGEAVPEPASAVLVLCFSLLLVALRRPAQRR